MPHATVDPTETGRLVVVSNRLPVVVARGPDGEWQLARGSGGLVTALQPALVQSSGLWMGWPGVAEDEVERVDELLEHESEGLGYELRGIQLTAQQRDDFYLGFSNQVIWPLFHDFQSRCNFNPRFWEAYREVNRKFAHTVAAELREGDFLWIHDYHLMGVAEDLRESDVRHPTGFFLHIPFPAPDLFLKLPWRFSILRSLLHYQLLGFQTSRDRENFLRALHWLVSETEIEERGALVSARIRSQRVMLGVFPISIDVEEFERVATAPQVIRRAEELEQAHRSPLVPGPEPTLILLGVDRLDYSKGIPHKLRAFRLALRRYPELRGRVTLIQLVIPSREDIAEYHEMKEEIDRLVGEIAGEFTRPGWTPVHYRYGEWDRHELIAHYRLARVALVTPLRDGMNLVAKEFCTASPDGDGVLILSEHAGAAAQLQDGALLVNPFDVEEVAFAIRAACTLEQEERRTRMRRMRRRIEREDVHWWVRSFLRAAGGEDEAGEERPPTYRPPPPGGFFEGL